MIYYIICIVCSSFIFSNGLSFNTLWGKCTLINQSALSSADIINAINQEIQTMYNSYGPIPKNKFSIEIGNNKHMLSKHPHWKWSLGFTYHYPDKIFIKDPALSKIGWGKFKKVIAHELNHIMLNRISRHHKIPRWFKEGVAMKIANEISMYHKLKIASNTNNAMLFNLEEYSEFKDMSKQEFHFAYAISSASIILLEKIYGYNTIDRIIENLINGQTFQESFYNSTGFEITDFYEIFYNETKKHFFWFKFINLPKNLFAIMPLLLIIGFYIKSYKNKKIVEQWELEEELENIEDLDIN